jgi:hypothetical protein
MPQKLFRQQVVSAWLLFLNEMVTAWFQNVSFICVHARFECFDIVLIPDVNN